jgi:hypothetical protein
VLAEFAPQLGFDLLEVERLHGCTWAAVYSWLIPNDFRAERFWETANGLT